jgi:protein-L-isoaspartate(D-aspartate) O-methyltransferase
MVPGRVGDGDSFGGYRSQLVETLRRKGVRDLAVLRAVQMVPRHLFVPESVRHRAYDDAALPIGSGQTISQPYVQARYLELIGLTGKEKVLEIGTGSGYQAAVLSPLAARVYSIEIVLDLGRRAGEVLHRLGYGNVETKIADGYYGWPEAAPFDAIVVTAASSHIPPALIQQLKPGGRMVIPIGGPFSAQQLMLIEKQPSGGITTRQLLPVQFVPFIRPGQR